MIQYHPSHKVRMSDSSFYTLICDECGADDSNPEWLEKTCIYADVPRCLYIYEIADCRRTQEEHDADRPGHEFMPVFKMDPAHILEFFRSYGVQPWPDGCYRFDRSGNPIPPESK